jgi:ABC-type microcin C transport system permease subunit YejE
MKRRLRLGGRAPPFMMGHLRPNALVGARTHRPYQSALSIATYLREHWIGAQHLAIYNNALGACRREVRAEVQGMDLSTNMLRLLG